MGSSLEDSRDDRGRRRLWLWYLLGAALLVLVSARVVVGVAGQRRLDEERAAWSAAGRGFDTLAERFPPRDENGSALELEELTAAIGVNLTPRSSERLSLVFDEDNRRKRQAAEASLTGRVAARHANTWLAEIMESEAAAVPEPPGELLDFHVEHADRWAAIRRHVLESPVPEWQRHVGAGWDAPVPNLLGVIELQRLLLSDALLHERAGRFGEAVTSFAASWRFNSGLRQRPELISQLISIAIARMQAGVARRLSALPAAPWVERLVEHDFQASLLDACVAEASAHERIASDPQMLFASDEPPNALQRTAGTALAPVARIAAAEVLAAERGWVESVAASGSCPVDPQAFGRSVRASLSRWNRVGLVVLPDLASAADRSWHGATQLELSSKVLAARGAAGAPDASWSRARCPDATWLFEATAEGGFRVAYEGPVAPMPGNASPMPPAFEAPARP